MWLWTKPLKYSTCEHENDAIFNLWDLKQQPFRGPRFPAVTYMVSGIQVTVGINEELDQGGAVVSHSQVHWRGAPLWKGAHLSVRGPPQLWVGLSACGFGTF